MDLTMLGTGHAMVMKCYNTCFALSEGGECFLVDGGGGNTILRQLNAAGIGIGEIRNIFVTHKHTDHILGILWVIRAVCGHMGRGRCPDAVNLYGSDEVIKIIRDISNSVLQDRETAFLDRQLILNVVRDGEERVILGNRVTFFDIHSTKAKQYGFSMELGTGGRLTCCGDEPYHPSESGFVRDSKWLLHEAFCLHSEADRFHPYKMCHSTVKDACETAERMGVENLVLYHTEDENIERRKELYTMEGRRYFSGNLFVPDDLERIEL